jgi:hypothetical protein
MKTQAIYFSYRLRSPETHLALNGWNIPVINHVKYRGVMEMIEARPSEHLLESTPYSKMNV